MRQIPGLSRTVGYAAGGTLVLGLLVVGCVFAGMAGPALSLHTRTQALQQTMAGLANPTKSLQVSTDWGDFTSGLSGNTDNFGIGETENLNLATINLATREMARGYKAIPLPLGPGAWASLTSGTLGVLGAGPHAQAGGQPKVEIVYRDPLTSNVRVVAGSYTSPRKLPADTVAVAATKQVAARFGLHPGSRLRIPAQGGIFIGIYVTAIVAERDPGSTFWNQDVLVGSPELNTPSNGLPYWVAGLIADPDQLAAMQNQFSGPGMEVSWEFPLDTSGVNADQAQGLYNDLNHAVQASPALTGPLKDSATTLTVASPLIADLSVFLATQTAIQTVLLLLFVSLIVVGAAVIVLAARMIVLRRADELSMLRARGGSLRQVAVMMVRAALITAVPAAAIGVALAIAVVPGGSVSSPAGWWLVAITVAAALAGPPLVAVWQHRRPTPASNPARITTAETGRTRIAWRRPVAEVTAIAACIGGVVVLHDQGLPTGGGVDLYLTLAPVLVAIPVVLVMLRLYPLVVRAVLKVTKRGSGATGFVALSRAARSSLTGVLPAFALVLALSLATFAGMISDGVARGEAAAAWQATGADVQIDTGPNSGPVTTAAVHAIAGVHGVSHATAVWNTNWITGGGQPMSVVAVDPPTYAAVTSGTPFPGFPSGKVGPATGGVPGGLSGGATAPTVPVLASPAAAAILSNGGSDELFSLYPMGPFKVRVVGILDSTPALPGGGAFVVMALQTLPGLYGQPQPNRVLVTGSGIDDAQLAKVANKVIPGNNSIFRTTVLAGLNGSPLQHGAAVIIVLTIAATAAFGLFIVILGLALGSYERELTLARLTVMGHERATGLVMAETLPAVVAAVIAGAACALVLPKLIGSSIDLSAFTGTGAPVQFQPDVTSFALPAAAIVVLAVAALTAESRSLRRHGVADMLRAQ